LYTPIGYNGGMDVSTHPGEETALALEGMTCAACAARIEKVLNRLPGTHAAVNFATESAAVRHDPAATPVDALIGAVERAGYHAHVKRDAPDERAADEKRKRDAYVALRRELVVAAILTFPLIVPMLPMLVGGAHMDVLVALGTTMAYALSAAVTLLGLDEHVYFEASSAVITLVLL